MERLEISVIMLTYNREPLVSRAIESILRQSFANFEFIIVDNGSTDGSGKIADEYSQKDRRIKVIHRECGNIGSGRNAGLNAARGKYVAFIDDDDWCEPDFLGFLLGLAEENKADIAACGSNKEEKGKISPNGKYVYNQKYVMNAEKAVENFLWRLLYNCAMPTKLLKRSLFDKIRFAEKGSYDDISTTYKYFANAGRVAAYGIPKYTFYRHNGNNSSAATKHHLLNPVQLAEYLAAYRERTEYIGAILPSLIPLARYSEWSYMISMIEKIERFGLANCKKPLDFMKNEVRNNLDEFLNGGFILDFEREWAGKFL